MKKKYFFFDIDGTLTDRKTGKIVPSAREALTKLEESGHFVSLCTGRAWYKAEWFRKDHNFANMVCNGGHGLVKDGKLLENRPLPYEPALALYEQALDLGYGVLAATADSQVVRANSFKFIEQVGERKEPTTYIINPDFHPDQFGSIYKLYISVPKEKEEELVIDPALGKLRFMPEYLMIQPDEKLDGIERMLGYAGGQMEDVVVFGDDTNDLVMFDPRFVKVAMGNGVQALKDKADLVADDNIHDGIWKICEEQGWFKPVDES